MDLKVNCKVSLKSEGLWHDEAEPAAPSTHLEASLVQTEPPLEGPTVVHPCPRVRCWEAVCRYVREQRRLLPLTHFFFFFFFIVDNFFTVFTELVTIFLLFYVLGWVCFCFFF